MWKAEYVEFTSAKVKEVLNGEPDVATGNRGPATAWRSSANEPWGRIFAEFST